jgi:hypothetical protein
VSHVARPLDLRGNVFCADPGRIGPDLELDGARDPAPSPGLIRLLRAEFSLGSFLRQSNETRVNSMSGQRKQVGPGDWRLAGVDRKDRLISREDAVPGWCLGVVASKPPFEGKTPASPVAAHEWPTACWFNFPGLYQI